MTWWGWLIAGAITLWFLRLVFEAGCAAGMQQPISKSEATPHLPLVLRRHSDVERDDHARWN